MSLNHDYDFCGLRIRSNRRLPGLRIAANASDSDVEVIVKGKAAVADFHLEYPGNAYVRRWSAQEMALSLPPYGTLRMTPGTMEVALQSSMRWTDMRSYVVGTGLAVSMYQLAVIPHHASSICLGEDAIAFTGPSGVGKSTFATAWLRETGADLVSDDVAAIEIGSASEAWILPGAASVRLCPDSFRSVVAAELGRRARGRARNGKHEVQGVEFTGVRPRLRAMIILENSLDVDFRQLERITGRARVSAWMNTVHRIAYGTAIMGDSAIASYVLGVAESVPMYRFKRSRSFHRIGEDVAFILQELQNDGIWQERPSSML